MERTRVFLRALNPELNQQLQALPALKRCIQAQGSEDGAWYEEYLELDTQIALISVDDTSDAELASIDPSCDVDFIFFSDGKPNQTLDALMSRGAGYHFRTPYDFEAVNEALEDLLLDLVERHDRKTQALSSDLDQFGDLVGSDSSMRKLYRAIRRVSSTDANVLIIGESGTGKELVATTVHKMSTRSELPFVAINCGALAAELIDSQLFGHKKGAFTGATSDHKGVFEQAGNGTVFLDEVTEMPIEQQVKLLRVLEQGEFKPVGSEKTYLTGARVIAATNRDPFEAMEEGRLREDLYFRLAQFPIIVPALRERGDDVAGLAKHFVAYLNETEKQHISISEHALKRIAEHEWPGNVRELRHCIERAYILAEDCIEEDQILIMSATGAPDKAELGPLTSGLPLEEIEQAAIEQSLKDNDGNKTETAEQLGISVKTLYNKLEKYQNDDDA